jgi:hypothetical protein
MHQDNITNSTMSDSLPLPDNLQYMLPSATNSKLDLTFILNNKRSRPEEDTQSYQPLAKAPRTFLQQDASTASAPLQHTDNKQEDEEIFIPPALPPLASLLRSDSRNVAATENLLASNESFLQLIAPHLAHFQVLQKPVSTASAATPQPPVVLQAQQSPPPQENTANVSEHHQLSPIRILAHQIGLSKDPNKSWRYRDIKRSLFEKMTPEQERFIDGNPEHCVIKDRLPHKLSMVSFAKRIMLMVFHFILRDGREPKFWKKQTVNHDILEQVLTKNEPQFYQRINRKVAFLTYQIFQQNSDEKGTSKMSYEAAMQQALNQLTGSHQQQ